MGYSPSGCKETDMTDATENVRARTHTHVAVRGRVKNRKKYRFDWLLNFDGAVRDSKFCRGQAFLGKGQS